MTTTVNWPPNPALNDTYTVGDRTWIWNGTGWRLQVISPTAINQAATFSKLILMGA